MTSQLTQLPLDISARWLPKTVTTDPPRLTPHEEWRLAVRLVAAAPFRLAVLMYLPTHIRWGLRPEDPSEFVEVPLDFFPQDWATSERVQVNFGWQSITVTDPELKADPRPHASVVLPASATTAQVIPVCEVRRHAITLAVLAIAHQDTEGRRLARWRLRPHLASALPPDLCELASGRQSGTAQRETGPEPGDAIPT